MSTLRHLLAKQKVLISGICIYGLISFGVVMAGEINAIISGEREISWHYFLLMITPLGALFVSSVGLWYERKWAYIVQFFLYLFQTVSYQDPEIRYFYSLGPRFYIDITLNLPDGQVVQGFNLIAICILVLLIIAFIPGPKPRQKMCPTQ